MKDSKYKTKSFSNQQAKPQPRKSTRFDYSPEKSQGRNEYFDSGQMHIRFKRKRDLLGKDLQFDPGHYITGEITYEDVVDLKEVFDTYDSTGMGVLLPNDLKLLLTQNGFVPNKRTIYEIVAEFDTEEAGGISFSEFMKAMDTKPYLNENKKDIGAIFKKYDRTNKGYLNLDDLRQINRHTKQNLDEETLRLMLEKADSNKDDKISFEDFYSVMVRNIY